MNNGRIATATGNSSPSVNFSGLEGWRLPSLKPEGMFWQEGSANLVVSQPLYRGGRTKGKVPSQTRPGPSARKTARPVCAATRSARARERDRDRALRTRCR